MVSRWLAIISDLHVSNGALDDFDTEIETALLSFLEDLGGRAEGSELIINGDFLDFVQASPWTGTGLESRSAEGIPLCFTEEQSLAKLASIAADHPRLFEGLRLFLASEENALTIIPGNHDHDFFWPQIQAEFRVLVGEAPDRPRTTFGLSGPYRPSGFEWLWIEHGHRLDPVNCFYVGGEERWSLERPPIFKDKAGTPRLLECTGTRFMIRYLNGIDSRYPFVDNVKPFSRFLRIFGASALTIGRGPLDAAVAVTKMMSFLGRTTASYPSDLLSIQGNDGNRPAHPVLAWIGQASPAERQSLKEQLAARGLTLDQPLQMLTEPSEAFNRLIDMLADNLDLVAGLGEKDGAMLGADPGTLTLAKGFRANETEDLFRGAEQITHSDVTTVAMGHTHEWVERQGALSYFNTGSWTRYYRFAEGEATQPWSILRERSYERFPYSLRYLCVAPGNTHASMETWQERLAE